MEVEKLISTWNTITDLVKNYDEIDPAQATAFFSRLQPQAQSDGFLMLTTDSEFIKSWIERNYISFISRALEELSGIPTQVLIEVDTQQTTLTPQVSNYTQAPTTPVTPSVVTTISPVQQIPQVTIPFTQENPVNYSTEQGNTIPQGYSIPQSNIEEQHSLSFSEIKPSDRDDNRSVRMEGGTSVEMESFSTIERAEDTPTSRLTFENYVIGDSNRMAYTMANEVAKTPGKSQLNPLFIYGRSGCGKTHLLRAIQNSIHHNQKHLRTYYVDSAELLSDYMEASAAHDREKSSFKNFKTRYEDVDILLIDDVQFLQGKKQTLDIVFQIFNKLTSQGKQVVLAADRAPKNIDIDDRYSSRFNSGGTFDIQAPEIETKLGVIKTLIEEYRRAENHSFTISNDVQLYIAEHSNSNLRELRSAVTKVIQQMELFKTEMSIKDITKLLENHFTGGPNKRLSIADIQSEVEGFYRISHADLVGKKRNQNIMTARQVGIYLSRVLLDLPYNDIGKQFNRDHSTVMYSINCIEDKIKESREVEEEINTLRQIITDSYS